MRELADQMDSAAEALGVERAAELRDHVAALRSVQSRQVIEEGSGDLDIVAAILEAGLICVHILFIRQGRVLGSRSFYPKANLVESEADVLTQFLPQFYLGQGREIPREIITSHPMVDADVLDWKGVV